MLALLQRGTQIRGCWKPVGGSAEVPGQALLRTDIQVLLGWLCMPGSTTQAEPPALAEMGERREAGKEREKGGDGKSFRDFSNTHCEMLAGYEDRSSNPELWLSSTAPRSPQMRRTL